MDASTVDQRSRDRRKNSARGCHQKAPTPPNTIEEFRLIKDGFLPRADFIIPESGNPAWGLDSFAIILGVSRETLIARLRDAGARFDPIERTDLT